MFWGAVDTPLVILRFPVALSGRGFGGAPRLEVRVWLQKVAPPKQAAMGFLWEEVSTKLVVAF